MKEEKLKLFKQSEEICKKVSDSGCVSGKELQQIEMGLKLFDLYEEMLDQVLGLDLYHNEQLELDFQLKYALERNEINKIKKLR